MSSALHSPSGCWNGAPVSAHDDGVLREIPWSSVRKGDLLLAVVLNERMLTPASIPYLTFWHVVDVADEFLHVDVNVIAGCGSNAEYVSDRVAGLLGLPPSVRQKCR